MYNIETVGLSEKVYTQIHSWIDERFPKRCNLFVDKDQGHPIDIFIVQVRSFFDWVKIKRLQKKHFRSKIIVIMSDDLLKSAPLAVELGVSALHLTPVRKNVFLNSVKEAMVDITDLPVVRETFLRKLMYGEIKSQEEFQEYKTYAKMEYIPNIVCLVQGNKKAQDFIENEEGKRIVRSHLRSGIANHLSHYVKEVYYVHYSRYFGVLFHIPYVYKSIREWEELRYYLLKMIDEIKKEYGVSLHVGIGSVYNDPMELDKPFREARKALTHSLEGESPLCFHEEITNDEHLQKCIEYISNNYHEDLSIKKVANKVHLSHTYFSRLFKKELGVSFVEYVTNVRIKRAKWLLGNTNDSIESIAEQVGFNTPNYFSSIFKKHVDASPSEYREKHLINANL